jgi:hypothetical protein
VNEPVTAGKHDIRTLQTKDKERKESKPNQIKSIKKPVSNIYGIFSSSLYSISMSEKSKFSDIIKTTQPCYLQTLANQ